MPPFLTRLHYLRNRVHDCRLLREMDVVARLALARHLRNAKKLPSLAAGTPAIFSAPHRGRPERAVAKYIEQRGGVCRLLRRSELKIHLSSSHPVRLVGSEGGWLTYLYEPLV
jgi:hypothetical protein